MFTLLKTEGHARRGVLTCAHGTAFDKVGKATATTDSFERAVKAVSRMAIAKRAKKA